MNWINSVRNSTSASFPFPIREFVSATRVFEQNNSTSRDFVRIDPFLRISPRFGFVKRTLGLGLGKVS
jgi:hypothetical protein